MQNIVEINKLDFNYKDKEIFKDFNLDIKSKRFVTILGKNGSGKTTLTNILMGLIDSNGKIIIDGIILSNETKKFLRKNIGVVFENPDEHFVTEKVYDELAFVLESMDYQKDDIDNKIIKVSELIGIEDLLNRRITSLSVGEKQLVALATAIINNPKLLIMDEGLSNVDFYYREIILKILNVLRKKGMTIINITSNSEDSIYGTDIVIINNGKVILNKTLLRAYKEEKAFTGSGLSLPFIADISLKLKYYNLTNKIYIDEKSLVNDIWK
jgi:energy-coupling factor transport system ATP-binding protein